MSYSVRNDSRIEHTQKKIYDGNAENSDLSFEEFRIDLFTVYAAILSSGQSDSKWEFVWKFGVKYL